GAWGRRAVREQVPKADRGARFPTPSGLTCPPLVAQVSRLEAAGGVERWTNAARVEPALATSLADADALQRRLRPELDAGVAGARRGTGSLKCLHAHVAFALAQPGYELGERVVRELEPLWPPTWCSE